MTIWGWAALIEYTKLNDQIVRRAIAHYGFPPPVKVRQGKKSINVWDKPLVSEWLRRSHMLYFMQERRAKLRINTEQADLDTISHPEPQHNTWP